MRRRLGNITDPARPHLQIKQQERRPWNCALLQDWAQSWDEDKLGGVFYKQEVAGRGFLCKNVLIDLWLISLIHYTSDGPCLGFQVSTKKKFSEDTWLVCYCCWVTSFWIADGIIYVTVVKIRGCLNSDPWAIFSSIFTWYNFFSLILLWLLVHYLELLWKNSLENEFMQPCRLGSANFESQ
jgi:hypothetical protein